MSRRRERVCLEAGLKLDLNWLARSGLVRPGANIGARRISWATLDEDQIASGTITADMSGPKQHWFRIQTDDLDQLIILAARPRHFGGFQWYFMCPKSNRQVSILWKPPGADGFRSRQAWGKQVAYRSQFCDAAGRADIGEARIKSRLIAGLDPEAWDLPPKPKWMRWATYDRYGKQYEAYEKTLDNGFVAQVKTLPIK